MKMQITNSILAMTVLTALTVACSKKKDNAAAAPEVSTQSVELVNTTTSEVAMVDGKYLVMPPAMEIGSLPSVKGCNSLKKFEQEVGKKVESAERDLAELKGVAEADDSVGESIDQLVQTIEDLKMSVEKKRSLQVAFSNVYDKKELLANLATLKAANPALALELGSPDAAVVSIENSNRHVTASETKALSQKSIAGSFTDDSAEVTVSMKLTKGFVCDGLDLLSQQAAAKEAGTPIVEEVKPFISYTTQKSLIETESQK